MLVLKGTYGCGNGKRYRNGYYDALKSEEGNEQVTIIVSETLRSRLKDGLSYLLKGALHTRLDDIGACRLQFRVSEIVGEDATGSVERERQEAALLARKQYRDVNSALSGLLAQRVPPKVLLIYPKTDIDQDMRSALGESAGSYEFIDIQVSITDPNAIIQVFEDEHTGDVDLIVLLRGGGHGLDALNDLSLAEAALSLTVPFVTAVGHEMDRLLIERVADARFATPSRLGIHLNDLARNAEVSVVDLRAEVRKELDASYRTLLEGTRKAQEESEEKVDKLKYRLNKMEKEHAARERALMKASSGRKAPPLLLLLIGLLLGVAGTIAYFNDWFAGLFTG